VTSEPAGSLSGLRACFGGRLLTDAQDMAPFLTDWRRRWTGRAVAVAQPDDTAGVSAIMGWCHAAGMPVVPQGGNTGLSGGSVPDGSGRALLLSLTRLDRIREVDPANNTMVVEAGCTLQRAQQAAEAASRLFPLSLAAEGSCTIGGNLATNAGGVHVLRYGTARELCLGLEVVTPSGEIWNGLRGLRKDNSGYDLRGLFIGAEGTLGVITAAVLRLYPRPLERTAAFVALASPASALHLLQQVQGRFGAGLTAFELMNGLSLDLVMRHTPRARSPLGSSSPWYVLLEISRWADEEQPGASLLALLEQAMADGTASDATLSTSGAQFASLWALREAASDAQAKEGGTIKHDIALPASRIAAFLDAAEPALTRAFPSLRLVIWGHLGDGNLHYNLSPSADRCGPSDAAWFIGQEPAVNRLVHDLAVQCGGSISAEHGLGVLRRDEAARYKPHVEQRLMRAIKDAIDPLGIMNPGKLLPPGAG
jgi:FAD/FMN-containing dehydrogenase